MSAITYRQSTREYTEGIGSLFQRVLLSYLISSFLKIKFKRSKLVFYNKHNKNYYSEKIYKLFSFFGEHLNSSNVVNVNNIKDINKKKKLNYNLNFSLTESFFRKLNGKKKDKLISNLRTNFWIKNKIILQKNAIVLHLRNYSKGDDVLFNKFNFERSFPYQIFSFDYHLPDHNPAFYKNWYISLVKKIILDNRLKKKNIKIYLCSTGQKKEFTKISEELSKLGKFKLLLNFNEFKTLKLMINAEYLILAQSSYSYLASFLNCGKKYIRNSFRHPLPRDVVLIKDYQLLKISYFYYYYCRILEKIFKLKLFFKYTDFIQIIKNKLNNFLRHLLIWKK